MRYVVFNRKGGVGKSTITCNLAAVAAEDGARVLVVDLDPQGNATQYLSGRQPGEIEPNLHGYFDETLGFRLSRTPPSSFAHATSVDGVHLLAAASELSELQPKLESRHKIYKLRDLLDVLNSYDHVFIDTPPAVNFFTVSALIASHRCLIPFDCDEFSRRALYRLLDTVREVREDHNPKLEVGGVVVNQFDARANLPGQLVAELEEEGLPVLSPYLGATVKVRESHQQHQPLVTYLPRHKVSEQFRVLWRGLRDAS
ncbi:MAG: ParA family protein [Acidobacteriota bacterium]